jgi:hypothetical protein
MLFPLPLLPRRPARCRHMAALSVAALSMAAMLAACAPNGDFGAVRPMLVSDGMPDWLGRDAAAGPPTWPSSFELTDDERQLRDLAFALIEQPYDRQQWFSVGREYGAIGHDHRGPFDRTRYAGRLFESGYRSPSARYSQIMDDIRNDITRLPQFFETATRVVDIDQKRRKSLGYISDLSPAERANALARIRENIALISLVGEKLAQRVASYRFALERLVITTPLPQAAEVERVLNQLQAQVARYRTRPTPTWVREPSLAAAR